MAMTEQAASWGSDWAVGLRVWVERAGQPILGPGRAELLAGIDRTGSISAAARQMGMSYRRAWLLIQAINDAAGEALVSAAPGGRHGGGASLSARGRQALQAFQQVQAHLGHLAARCRQRPVQDGSEEAVHVAAAVSLEEAVGQLLADYALYRPSVRVRAVFGASNELTDQILGGASADLLLAAEGGQIDRLAAAGMVENGPRTVLAENSLAANAPAGVAVAVRRPADLVRPALGRVALADPACPLGAYVRAYLEDLRLYEAVSARALLADSSRGVAAAVRARRADVGLVYASDATQSAACRLLFRVTRLPVPIRYIAALLARGARAEQARDLLGFLTSRQAASRFRRCGFRPVTQTAGPEPSK
jgi:molybdenum ABC transporter molybdate-binding protein